MAAASSALCPPWAESPIARRNIERRAREIEEQRGRRIAPYLGRNKLKRNHAADPREELPKSHDLRALADTFGADERRCKQALALEAHGLRVKAKRLVLCCRIGRRQNCQGDDSHRFFRTYRCQGRYCEVCGPAWFRKKYSDLLVALEPIVEDLLRQGATRARPVVVAKLDFTTPNTGSMPEPGQVREFHRSHHKFWRLVERLLGISRTEYGWAGCDEFGGSNSNLHRHSLYVGPFLPQGNKELSAIWSVALLKDRARRRELLRFARRDGVDRLWDALLPEERRFVSIKPARSFQAALAHALKYPSKFVSKSSPERLAALEAAFHKTRRFSTGGAFYRLQVMREPGEDSPVDSCPLCGCPLVEIVESWVSRLVLESEGRRDVEEARRNAGKQQVFAGAGPP